MGLLDRSLIRGALAGAIATIPMTWAMTRSREYLHSQRPNDELRANVRYKAGYPLDVDSQRLTTYVSRFAAGAVAGVVYSLLFSRIQRLNPEARGPVFGLSLWGLGAFRRANSKPSIAAHVLWGFSIHRLLQRPTQEWFSEAAMGMKPRQKAAKLAHSLVFQ